MKVLLAADTNPNQISWSFNNAFEICLQESHYHCIDFLINDPRYSTYHQQWLTHLQQRKENLTDLYQKLHQRLTVLPATPTNLGELAAKRDSLIPTLLSRVNSYQAFESWDNPKFARMGVICLIFIFIFSMMIIANDDQPIWLLPLGPLVALMFDEVIKHGIKYSINTHLRELDAIHNLEDPKQLTELVNSLDLEIKQIESTIQAISIAQPSRSWFGFFSSCFRQDTNIVQTDEAKYLLSGEQSMA
jgi:hypothetical protein